MKQKRNKTKYSKLKSQSPRPTSHISRQSFNPAPLNTSLFVSSIIGIIVSAFYIWRITIPWAAAFIAVFTVIFIASMISMSKGEMRD